MKKYDLAVIGAGSAGLVAATTAKRKGLKTILIEKRKIGGECTHSGCIPSKAFLNAAKQWHTIQKSTQYGLPKYKGAKPDFSIIMKKVNEIIDSIYQHETPDIFQSQGIDTVIGSANFIDAHKIDIERHGKIHAKNTIICTGSSPNLIPFEGSEKLTFLHNDNFWELRKQPNHIVFIGGGVISLELGSAIAQLGSKVTIVEVAPRILGVADEEVSIFMTSYLQNIGVNIITNANITAFKKAKNKHEMHLEADGKELVIKADEYFQAVGRRPNISGLNLEKAGVKYTRHGIKTNRFLQTSAKNIYTCGDVTTPYKFTHTASYQANICVDNIIDGNKKVNDLSVLPWGVFTEPEIGHVGLTEKEGREQYGDSISVFRVDATIDRFITDQKTGGFLKVIFNDRDLVIGADAVGHHAGEWIQILTVAIKNKIPASKMADTIFAYPTYSEIVKKAFTRYLRTK